MTLDEKQKTLTSSSPSLSLKNQWWKSIWENLQIVIIALVLALVIRTFIAEPRYIPSESMLPTLEIGDRLVVEKVSYYFHTPQRGDIIVFEPPTQLRLLGYQKEQAFIKRVVGLPGETIAVIKGKVYINNQPLLENYLLESPNYNLKSIKIPDHKLFVMGDNRNNSNDSHAWGFLPQKNVIGHAIFRFFPFARIGKI
ncbi:MAG TPA: signal peptidase I [Cyanothece sp. UBA12306]|nr:signal peptidase I [Cyanothece sp. UBA12306]